MTSAPKMTRRLLAGLFLSPLAVLAQTPPSAGQLLQQPTQAPRRPAAEAAPTTVEETAAAPHAEGGERFAVARIRFSGNTLFPDAVLQGLVAGDLGTDMDLAGLDALAARVTRHYREHGYMVARAWLPPQDVSDGTVTIAVLEGRIGEVTLDDAVGVARNATAPLQRLHAGDAVDSQALESTLLRLADLPGAEVKSTLRPGASVGTSDFLVELLPTARLTGNLDADNFGNRYVGAERAGASLFWNNPAGLGDQLGVRVQTAGSGYSYGRIGYQLPFGRHAARVGAAWSSMRYALGKEFDDLDADGSATVGSFHLQQPLLRSRRGNLFTTLQYDDKRLRDDIGATRTRSRKTLRNGTLSLHGDFVDALGGGASNRVDLGYLHGQLDLDAASAAIDQAGARSSGGFDKWMLSWQRLQHLSGDWLLTLDAAGQWAGDNLDASEKMFLGGSTGVRAYPQGEAGGDSGHLVRLELHHPLSGGLEAFGFYDLGRVRINHSPWDPAADNHRRLAGYGLGAAYTVSAFGFQAFAAWKDGTGEPTSDKDRSPRIWAQASYRF